MNNKNGLGKESNCSGCTACLNICPKQAIEMRSNERGFLSPFIDERKCISCGLCLKICPWIKKEKKREEKSVFYSAKRKILKKRMLSQSGGAFSVFAEEVLKQKGIVYGVEFANNRARYCRIHNFKGLRKIRGSKYVQADVGNIFSLVENDLRIGKKVLCSGTACHIDGLKRYLAHKKVDASNLITIDIICHGVVSPMIFNEYFSYLESTHNKKINNFNFRNKTFGWHGHYISYQVGNNHYKSKNYVKIFYSSYPLRQSCYSCLYSNLNRISDITIGDCWGIGDHFPEFDDNKGCSLIIPNSVIGKELFNRCSRHFEYLKIDKEQALQPNLQHPTEKPLDYENFWHDYSKFGFEYVVYKYCDFNTVKDIEVVQKHQLVKRLIGKIRRFFGAQ